MGGGSRVPSALRVGTDWKPRGALNAGHAGTRGALGSRRGVAAGRIHGRSGSAGGALYAPVALDTCRGSRHQGEVPGSNASPASCRPSEFTCWSPVFLTREQVPSGSEVPRGSYRPRGGCRRPSGLSRARERSVSGVSPPHLDLPSCLGPLGTCGHRVAALLWATDSRDSNVPD